MSPFAFPWRRNSIRQPWVHVTRCPVKAGKLGSLSITQHRSSSQARVQVNWRTDSLSGDASHVMPSCREGWEKKGLGCIEDFLVLAGRLG